MKQRWIQFNELFLIFFCTSLVGCILETIFCYFALDTFEIRGFLVLPLCPIYGFAVVAVYFFFGTVKEGGLLLGKCRKQPLRAILYFLFVSIVPTLAELLTGLFFDHFFDIRLWDYSAFKYNFMGHICLEFSLAFAVLLSVAMVTLFPAIRKLIRKLPKTLMCAIGTPLFFLVLIDFFYSLAQRQA